MFLSELKKEQDSNEIFTYAKQSCTYKAYYEYWIEQLFERIMRLFVWENTDDVEPKEIEERLLLQGHCGITKILGEKELTAMFGNFYGVSKYVDDKPYYMVRCPLYSGSRTIGKDIVIIRNNSLKNSTYSLVHHYATLLAHNEVTLVDTLINVRDGGGIPVATTEKQKQSIIAYQSKIFNGQYGAVTDIGNLGLQYIGSDRKTHQNIMDIVTTREKILKSFYSDIGVRSAFEKRSNSVEAEVEADTSLLLLNLSDMLDSRKKGAEEVNKLFGTNWNVHIAKEIDYSTENQKVAFNSADDIHVKEDNNANS